VGDDLEAGAFEQGPVVFPARVADHDLGRRVEALQEVGAELEPAGAAEGLHGRHAAGLADRRVGAKYEILDRTVVSSDAIDRQVVAGLRRFHHQLFGRLHAGQQRQLAVLVEVDADAEVDLCRIGVGVELIVESEDRVAGRQLDVGEEGGHGLSCE
jgi:hypothetical protein